MQKRDLRGLGDTQSTGSGLTWVSVGTVESCLAAETGKYMRWIQAPVRGHDRKEVGSVQIRGQKPTIANVTTSTATAKHDKRERNSKKIR